MKSNNTAALKFIDLNTREIIGVETLQREYIESVRTDPENTQATFTAFLLEIILATINGRNDLEIMDCTPREIMDIVSALRKLS